jgi:hypothetical protein
MGRKKKERDVLSLEIIYDHKEELEELIESKDFHQLLLDESIKVIEESLKVKGNEVKLFSISNLDCFITLNRLDFPKVISKAIQLYESLEDYDKCAELVKLKKKVNETKKRNKKNT